VDGVQYIAVAAGRGLQPYYQPNYSRVLVGGTAELPPKVEYVPPVLDPPPSTAPPEVIARGAELYGRNCVQCHGSRTGDFPDLRYSPALRDQALFDAIVLDGIRTVNGMASFAAALTREDAAAVREYLITLALQAKAEEEARSARQADSDAEPHAQ